MCGCTSQNREWLIAGLGGRGGLCLWWRRVRVYSNAETHTHCVVVLYQARREQLPLLFLSSPLQATSYRPLTTVGRTVFRAQRELFHSTISNECAFVRMRMSATLSSPSMMICGSPSLILPLSNCAAMGTVPSVRLYPLVLTSPAGPAAAPGPIPAAICACACAWTSAPA